MQLPARSEVRAARRVVLVVGAVYLAVQVVAFSADRAPGWDEAIYLSQVDPDAEALPFVPSRARGITLLVAPVLLLGGSLEHVRVVLALLSSIALIGVAWSWTPVVGYGAAAGAVLAAGAWPVLFYGTEVMPNLFAAFAGAAATAVLARKLTVGPRPFDELIAGALVAAMAFVRPLDAAVLTIVLVLVPLLTRARSLAWSLLLPLGLAVGWAPWTVEMVGRFGGLGDALAAAADVGHTGRWSAADNVIQYLALSDGPTAGPVIDPTVPRSGLFWLLGWTVLVVVGFLDGWRRRIAAATVVPLAAGVVLAAVYVVFTSIPAPRFLLPALVLSSFPAGIGLSAAVRGLRPPIELATRGFAAALVAVVLTGAWLASQLAVATKIEDGLTANRASAARAGARVGEVADGDPCRIFSSAGFPMIGYAAGCEALPTGRLGNLALDRRANQLIRRGIRPFLVRLEEAPPAPPSGAFEVGEVEAESGRSWFLYVWGT